MLAKNGTFAKLKDNVEAVFLNFPTKILSSLWRRTHKKGVKTLLKFTFFNDNISVVINEKIMNRMLLKNYTYVNASEGPQVARIIFSVTFKTKKEIN